MSEDYFILTSQHSIDAFIGFEQECGTVKVRNKYTDLICKKCNSLNELSVLQRRDITLGAAINKKFNYVETNDMFAIASSRLRLALESIDVESIQYYDIVDNPGYYAMSSNNPIMPKRGPYYHFDGLPCEQCGKEYNVVFDNTLDSRCNPGKINVINLYNNRRVMLSLLFSRQILNKFYEQNGRKLKVNLSKI